jgi:RNA polymerase sigma-70 factor (ECF subfamily)
MEKTDDELISEYRSGNEGALKILIERYTKPIYIFTFRMSGNQGEAEDITQETFVKMWRSLPKYKMTNTFRSLLFTIARNTALDHLRRKKVAVFSDFEDAEGNNFLTETLSDPETLPQTIIEKAEQTGSLNKSLLLLSPEDREILLLHYEQDMTFETIGTILQKPLNTVKSRHRRALAKLRESIEKQDEYAPNEQ